MNREEQEIEFLTQYFGEDFREMTKEKYEENLRRFPYASLVIEDTEDVDVETEEVESSELSTLLRDAVNYREERVSIQELMIKHILPNVVKESLNHEDLQRDVIVSDILEQVQRGRGLEELVRYYNRTRMTDEEIEEEERQAEEERLEKEKAASDLLTSLGAVEVEDTVQVNDVDEDYDFDEDEDEDEDF